MSCICLHFGVPGASERAQPFMGLCFEVFEGDGNLSVVQRQLLCLARAQHRKAGGRRKRASRVAVREVRRTSVS